MVENQDRAYIEAVEKFESDYFIDRESAVKLVDKLRIIQDNPLLISRRTNENVREGMEIITYEATPARVMGLLELVDSARETANFGTGLNPCKKGYDLKKEPVNLMKNLDNRLILLNYDMYRDELDLEKTVVALTPYFKQANILGASTSEEFVKNVVNRLVTGFKCSSSKIKDLEDYIRCVGWLNDFASEIAELDPERVMSVEDYNKRLQKDIKSCVKQYVNPVIVYQRILKEGLLESREHQIKLIVGWLDNFDIEDYSSAVEVASERVKRNEKQLKKLKDCSSPNCVIIPEEEILECQRYIKGILSKHRKSIVNYLGRKNE
jgi:hypothetical protein